MRNRAGSRQSRQPRPGLLRRLLAAALVAVFVLGVTGTAGTLAVVGHYAGELPPVDALEAGNLAQATRIYDRNGGLLEELYHQNRTVVPLDKISGNLQRATIATEDRQFYEHQGVDYRRVAIAAMFDATHQSAAQGGSTITQQVVKLDVLQDTSRQLDRKVKELLIAEELERRYSKQRILEVYLNSIPYGNHAYGAEAAAQTYFGKPATELDVAEAAYLAGLPQSPAHYNPFGTPEQQQAARDRWRSVLDSMVAAGFVTAHQADEAFATEIDKRLASHRPNKVRDPRTAHFVDYVVDYLESRYGAGRLYEGGLQVTTSLDLETQTIADQTVKGGVDAHRGKGANTGALLAMDPRDGEILAMVGSADYNNANIRGQVNLTGVDPSGYRSPGSSFKPYTYGTGLESGLFNAASKVDDQDDVIGGHRFSDWDGRREGMIPLRQALQESRNLPALWTYQRLGGQKVVNFSRRLGLTTRIDNPDSVPNTLGTESVSMLEHLSAYSAFDNGGFKVTPHPVLKVVDGRGAVLESFDRQPSRERVLSPETAYLMTDILRGPPRLYLGLGGRPAASKSGTTESWTGAYWIGYTPDLALATYMAHIDAGDDCKSGFAQLASGFKPSGWVCPTNVLWGEHVGQSVWKPFLLSYYAKRSWPPYWTAPAGIVKRTVCRSDGRLADDKVPADQKYEEIFIRDVGEPGSAPCQGSPAASPAASPPPTPGADPTDTPSPGGGIRPVEPRPSPHFKPSR